MRALRLIAPLLLVLSVASAAAADSMRYLTYEAADEHAKWRTGDVTLAIRKGIISRRIDTLFRRKGSDLPLLPSDAPFDEFALRGIIGDRDPATVRLYAVDPQKGAKFMPIACEGKAEKAWVALTTPKPYKPLHLWVVRWDAQARQPALCVTMTYRYRGEWALPPAPNRAAQEAPYSRTGGR